MITSSRCERDHSTLKIYRWVANSNGTIPEFFRTIRQRLRHGVALARGQGRRMRNAGVAFVSRCTSGDLTERWCQICLKNVSQVVQILTRQHAANESAGQLRRLRRRLPEA
jgi:hypothetical protein